MASLFSEIIAGHIPGRFIWKDPEVMAFLTIAPLAEGHALVVPRQEVDRWTDADPELMRRLITVAQSIGAVQLEVFGGARAGLVIAGYEVNHVHLHVWPSQSMADFNFEQAEQNPDPGLLDAAAKRLRERLRARGHGEFVPT